MLRTPDQAPSTAVGRHAAGWLAFLVLSICWLLPAAALGGPRFPGRSSTGVGTPAPHRGSGEASRKRVGPLRLAGTKGAGKATSRPSPSGRSRSSGRRKAKRKRAVTLRRVTVKADPENDPDEKDLSSFVTVVRTKGATSRVRDLAEVLNSNAGVQIKRGGAAGSFSTISIRGSSAGQVLVLLDGTPLNNGGSSLVNLGDLPLDALERVEIYRGFAPPFLGGGAIGGVVNLVTRRPPGYTFSGASISFGSFATRKLNLFHSRRLKKLSVMAFANYTGTNGNFAYYDTHGTDLTRDDDRVRDRANNVRDTLSLSGRAIYRFTRRLKLKVSDTFTIRREGLPGIAHITTSSANRALTRNLLQAELVALRFPHKRTRLDVATHFLAEGLTYTDLYGEIGAGRYDATNTAMTAGLRSRLLWFPWRDSEISLSVEARHESIRAENRLNTELEPTTRTRTVLGPGLQWVLGLWKRRVQLSPSGRLEVVHNDYRGHLPFKGVGRNTSVSTSVKPTGRMGLKLRPLSWLWLKGNVGYFVRYPTLYDLFGAQGHIMGNPELLPEEGLTADGGVVLAISKVGPIQQLRLEYAFFRTATTNLIRYVQNSQHTVLPMNIDSALVTGHELRVRLVAFNHLRLQADVTLLETVNESQKKGHTGKALPGRPARKVTGRGELFARWGRLFYEVSYEGENYLDAENKMRLAPRLLHSVGATIVVGPLLKMFGAKPPSGLMRMSLTLEVKNLLNIRTEELPIVPQPPPGWPQTRTEPVSDYVGFPLPGRAFYVTFDWKS